MDFKEEIAKIDSALIHYVDEAGIDNDDFYEYGWSLRGERLHALKPGTKKQRISIIGALNQNTVHSPLVFEGYTNKELFELYLEQILIPNLKPGEYVVIDNASFHKGGRIKKLIEGAGCTLIYLPAYSPDLNPIEHFWHQIKNSIRKNLEIVDQCLFQAAQITFDKIGRS